MKWIKYPILITGVVSSNLILNSCEDEGSHGTCRYYTCLGSKFSDCGGPSERSFGCVNIGGCPQY